MAHSSGGAIQGISQNVVKQLILHPFDTAGTGFSPRGRTVERFGKLTVIYNIYGVP